MDLPSISDRALNRALLARQSLLDRAPGTDVLGMVERLVGMQAQAPRSPYVGLWTRLDSFNPRGLERLLSGRAVARLAVMRSTIHLVSADDAITLRAVTQPAQDRASRHTKLRREGGVDDRELARLTCTLLDREPRTLAALGAALQEHWPGVEVEALGMGARQLVPLVQIPPRGLWSEGGEAVHAVAQTWLGRPMVAATDECLDAVLRRYLAAFGPASVRDAQAWMGVTRLKSAFERLRPELVTFRSAAGTELFDLPHAPRPDAEVDAPVRLLPEFDNVLLAHADRTRIFPEQLRSLLSMGNGLRPAFLVDGVVAGMWRRVPAMSGTGAGIELTPFGRLSRQQRSDLEAEAHGLLELDATAARTAAATDGARRVVLCPPLSP